MKWRIVSNDGAKAPLVIEAETEAEARQRAMEQWYGTPTKSIPSAHGTAHYNGLGLHCESQS